MYWTRRIVLTGGPCGGKTSAMNHLHSEFQKWGFTALTCPEAFTVTALGQAHELYGQLQSEKNQQAFLQLGSEISQLCHYFEEYFQNLAKLSGRPSVIFCDRGLCDSKAYYPQPSWDMTLSQLRMNEKNVLERYLAVLHLESTAKGAKDFYINSNNIARRESVDEALQIDNKIIQAWKEHNKHILIQNQGFNSFQEKLESVQQIVEDILELPKTPLKQLRVEVNDEFVLGNILKGRILEQFEVSNSQMQRVQGTQYVLKVKNNNGTISHQLAVKMNHPLKPFFLLNDISEKQYLAANRLDSPKKLITTRLSEHGFILEQDTPNHNNLLLTIPDKQSLPSFLSLI